MFHLGYLTKNRKYFLSRWDRGGENNKIGCGVLDLPVINEFSNIHDGKAPDCMNYWFINGVTIPGEATIPDDVAQSDVMCVHQVRPIP